MSETKKPFILLLGILLGFFALDWALFQKGQYLLPNESPWNTNHFFNFEYEWEQIRNRPKTKPRLLVVGSSIAYYSLDQKGLEKALQQETGRDVEVLYLAYAGNSPLYVSLLLHRIQEIQPDWIVYPLNFIDFRIHRSYVLDPNQRFSDIEESLLVKDALTFAEAPQSLWVFPWETLRLAFSFMDWEERSRYLFASLFASYRTKEFVFQNLQNLYQHRWGRNTSYHAYAGADIPEGVNFMGWTGKRFSFRALEKMGKKGEGIWLEFPPFLFDSGKTKITFSKEGVERQIVEITKPGWNQIFLEDQFFQKDGLVTAELEKTWKADLAFGTYLDYHYDPMGVRLTQTFGLEAPRQGEQYLRPLRTEDLRYNGMPEFEYKKYFHYRLLEGLEKRPGIGYLVALEKAKKRIASEPFVPKFHFQYLRKIQEECDRMKIPVLFINNPENPVSLEWYEGSEWYQGYLQFLEELSRGTSLFVDFRRELPMQFFSDFHHFTYPGMERMSSVYAKAIGNLFSK